MSYTYYDLDISDPETPEKLMPASHTIPQETVEAITKYLTSRPALVSGKPFRFYTLPTWDGVNPTNRDLTATIKQLSLAFPKVLFTMSCTDAEDYDDWTEYWLNGRRQIVRPRIPPFDPDQLRSV